MGPEPNRLPFGNTPQEEEPTKFIPPLPDIASLISRIKHQADKAKTIEAKIGFIDVGIEELKQIRTDGLRQYRELVDQERLDDPDPFWSYDSNLDKAINELGIYRRQLILEETDRSVPVKHEEPPQPKPLFASAGGSPTSTIAPQATPPEVMDIKQLAAHLRMSESWLYKNYESEGIPHFTLGTSLRFRRDEIDQWSRKQEEAPSPKCPDIKSGKPNRSAQPLVHQQRETEKDGASSISEVVSPVDASTGKRTVIEKMASLLMEAGHIDKAGEVNLVAWIESGCKELPETERIDWRTGRKTLCTFIVCAHHASLLPLEIGTKKSGKSGPLYEKAIISAFLDNNVKIRPGIDRTIAGPEEAITRFADIMSRFNQESEDDPQDEDILFVNIDDYFSRRNSPSFASYRIQLEEEFTSSDRKTRIFTEIEEGVLKIFSRLYKDCSEYLS